ncbi:MAG: acetoin utilization AcuB family protein [Bacteroidia bacterium]
MIVQELISDTIPPMKSSDSASMALTWMTEFKLNHLPIVDEGRYRGMITENDILDAANPEAKLGEIRFAGRDSAYVFEGQHVYDAIDIMSNLKLELLPVLDEENRYLGVITLRDIATHLSSLFATREPGSIIVLRIPHHGYVLSEIGQIVESADVKVLSLYLSQHPSGLDMVLTLKLSAEDPTRVRAAFERYRYEVLRTFYRNDNGEDLRSNLDALWRYLNF